MKTLYDLNREAELAALISCVIALVLLGIGIWRAAEGEWVTAAILWVGSAHVATR